MSELEKLRELLFAEEKKTLQSIKQRTESPDTRTLDVAEILPGAIGVSHARDPRLVKALREPIREGFEAAVRNNPKSFADALFPVIGPAIRKSIAETFKALVQSMNQTMEYSLSPRGLKWRMEAARAGIPLGEYILRKTLVYRIEQVYLIHRERGLMAGHVQNSSAVSQDAEAVSAMFTAIQDFVSDSFSPDHSQQLETADIGEFTVWVLQGPSSMLACVIRGVPPRGLRDELAEILERINLQFGEQLKTFDGDQSDLQGVEELLEECLLLEQRQGADERTKGGISPPLMIVMLLLAAGLTWWAISNFLEARRLDDFRQAVANTPGLVATELSSDGRMITMHGLADPLADDIDKVAERAGLTDVRVAAQLHPFQSLDAQMVLRRAKLILQPPESVNLELRGDTLVASGRAAPEWRDEFESKAVLIAGIARADASATVPSDAEILRQARQALAAPAEVNLQVSGQVLKVSGRAPQEWIEKLNERLAGVAGLAGVETDDLSAAERAQLETMISQLNGRAFYFESGSKLLDERSTALAATATQLKQLLALADLISMPVKVTILGHADGVGGRALNLEIMRQRAQVVRASFVDQGIAPERLEALAAPLPSDPRSDPRQRKAVLQLTMTPATLR